jgi:hypothetical protein
MITDNFCFICKIGKSKVVKQMVNGTVILSPLVFPGIGNTVGILVYFGRRHDTRQNNTQHNNTPVMLSVEFYFLLC